MDIAILLNNYKYRGSVTANTEQSYNDLIWEDERPKPTWQELQAQWQEIEQAIEAKEALKTQLVGLFESKLENHKGIRALYKPVMLEAVEAFDNGDMGLVYEIIDTSLTFGVTELEDLRAELLQALGGVE